MASHSSREQLQQLVEPVVRAQRLDLEDLQVVPAGRRRLLRVVVDGDGGVSLDRVAEVSQAVSAALDAADAMGAGPYVLEVTSPGVDRPLAHPRHWRRARSRLVRVQLAEGGELTGRVVDAGDATATLDVDGVARSIRYEAVDRAKVQVEFSHPDENEEMAGDEGDEGEEV
jgi:ribosome maturation factor RimP